jgi:hypothetical protein
MSTIVEDETMDAIKEYPGKTGGEGKLTINEPMTQMDEKTMGQVVVKVPRLVPVKVSHAEKCLKNSSDNLVGKLRGDSEVGDSDKSDSDEGVMVDEQVLVKGKMVKKRAGGIEFEPGRVLEDLEMSGEVVWAKEIDFKEKGVNEHREPSEETKIKPQEDVNKKREAMKSSPVSKVMMFINTGAEVENDGGLDKKETEGVFDKLGGEDPGPGGGVNKMILTAKEMSLAVIQMSWAAKRLKSLMKCLWKPGGKCGISLMILMTLPDRIPPDRLPDNQDLEIVIVDEFEYSRCCDVR